MSRSGFVLVPVVLGITLIALIAFLLTREASLDVRVATGSLQADRGLYVAEAGFAHQRWLLDGSNCTGYTNLSSEPFGSHSYSTTVAPTSGSPVAITATAALADGTVGTYSRSDVVVYDDPGAAVLQPAGRDAWINSGNPTQNRGGDQVLEVDGDTKRALLWFDLASAIPVGARVTDAQLGLHLQGLGPNVDVNVYRVTRAWTEGGVTWNTTDGAIAWTTTGGDYEGTASATTTLTGPGDYTWDVTALVDGWTRGSILNEGLLLRGEAASAAVFSSSEEGTASEHPSLAVSYDCLCGGCQLSATLAATADTYLRSTATNGTKNNVQIGETNSGGNYHTVIRFNVLSTLPANATIVSATLRLYESQQFGTQTITGEAHKLTQDWVELEANWNDASSGVPWSSGGGGTYDAAVLDSTATNTGAAWREWDVTLVVQEWVDAVSPDYGIAVVHAPVANGNRVQFQSRTAASNLPELVVQYLP